MQTTILSLVALAAAQLIAAHTDEKASFVTTLGRDTVVIESSERAGNRLTGDIIVRVPAPERAVA